MARINTIATSEKGALKPAVRTAINNDYLPQVADALEVLGFVYNADKKAFDLTFTDTNGTPVYMTLTSSVGLKASGDKAAKKSTSGKKKVSEPEVIEIED